MTTKDNKETKATKEAKEEEKPYAEYKKRHPVIQLLIGALGLIIVIIVLSLFMSYIYDKLIFLPTQYI